MVLIKDRHLMTSAPQIGHLKGNYDTYKGSTPFIFLYGSAFSNKGNYDTYKGSTLYFQLVLLHQNDWEL